MNEPSNGHRLNRSLGHLAARFSRILLRRINAVLSEHDLPITAEQYAFLVQLWECNNLPQGVLATKTARDKTTMARLAAGLEARNLIVRRCNSTDARERLVCLTNEGEQLMSVATVLVREILQEAQSGIAEDRLNICKAVLREACQNLER